MCGYARWLAGGLPGWLGKLGSWGGGERCSLGGLCGTVPLAILPGNSTKTLCVNLLREFQQAFSPRYEAVPSTNSLFGVHKLHISK